MLPVEGRELEAEADRIRLFLRNTDGAREPSRSGEIDRREHQSSDALVGRVGVKLDLARIRIKLQQSGIVDIERAERTRLYQIRQPDGVHCKPDELRGA